MPTTKSEEERPITSPEQTSHPTDTGADGNDLKQSMDFMKKSEWQENPPNNTSTSSWSTEVNLGPPSPTKTGQADDPHVRRYYEALQYTLYETGYPETIDRTAEPRRSFTQSMPAIVILSSPVECMCFVLEGGRQCPGDMILVMSTAWLSKAPKTNNETGSHAENLFVHKGITSDGNGNTYIDAFDPPRRVTYFVDYFTNSCTRGQKDDGEKFEKNLECPMSSSVELSRIVDDKLLTRILSARNGVAHPKTLAFPYKSSMVYDSEIDGITVFPLSSSEGVFNILSATINKFLSEEMESFSQVVVKPSGPMWFGSQLVSLHKKDNPASVIAAAAEVLSRLSQGDSLLVGSFCEPVQRTVPMRKVGKTRFGAMGSPQLGFRIRAIVCRNPEDEATLTSITCGMGVTSEPINGDNTGVQSLEATLRAWGICDPDEYESVRDAIKKKSEATLDALIEFERTLPLEMRGTVGAQTDLIGIDYVLTREGGSLLPVLTKVNSHDCTRNNQIFEFINPQYSGEAVGPLVATMLHRSLRYIMAGKRVLVIGAGRRSKMFIWKAAKMYNIEIYLVDQDRSNPAAKEVTEFIEMDITDHTKDALHCEAIAEIIQSRQLAIDGCVTFWEDCGPLAAMVCENLNLNGVGLRGAIIAKTKSLTHQVLSSRTADIPHWPRSYLYSSRSVRIESHMDIENAAHIIRFPAVMKLDYGTGAVGVKLVENTQQSHDFLDQIHRQLKTDVDCPGIGLGHGNAMDLMEYIEGTEHNIDVVIYRRKLVAAFVSDKGPTRVPNFTATSATMPSCLRSGQKNQLKVAAYQCCTEIGLENGTFNVEMKITPTGPKLIEINARMGGFCLRDWIKSCYKVDMLLCSFAISCGIKPLVPRLEPSDYIVAFMLTPTKHATALTAENWTLLQKMAAKGALRLSQFEEYAHCQKHEEPFCNIAVMDKDRATAKLRLVELCCLLGIDSIDAPFDRWFEDFV